METKTATVLFAHGGSEDITPLDGERFTTEEIQNKVDVLLELVDLYEDLVMIVVDSGKMRGMKSNWAATETAHLFGAIKYNEYICGDAMLIPREMLPKSRY